MSKLVPFIFAKLNETESKAVGWIVKIAHPDFVYYNSQWMGDSNLGKTCWVPDVDISKEDHEFATYDEAREFVKNWWRNNE